MLSVLLVLGLVAFLATSCKLEPADGTVTVRLINGGATVGDGKGFLFAVWAEGADTSDVDAAAAGDDVLTVGGTAEGVALERPAVVEPKIFSGGARLLVGAFIDMDLSGDPNTGDYVMTEHKPVTVDGDVTVTFDFDVDFVEFVELP